MRRFVLYQWTHAEVISSRSASVAIGLCETGSPPYTLGLLNPMVVSASALLSASPTEPTWGLKPPDSSDSPKQERCRTLYRK